MEEHEVDWDVVFRRARAFHRVRTSSVHRATQGTRRGISGFNYVAGTVIPTALFQQIDALTPKTTYDLANYTEYFSNVKLVVSHFCQNDGRAYVKIDGRMVQFGGYW
jgi:hypothetical protein